MLEVKVTVEAPEIVRAINNLALLCMSMNGAAKKDENTEGSVSVNATPSVTGQVPAGTNSTVAPVVDTNTTVPTTITPEATVVPTSAPAYTLDMISRAGAALLDAGKMNEVCGLLAKYGANAITALNPAQYGAFANDLRALGAQI